MLIRKVCERRKKNARRGRATFSGRKRKRRQMASNEPSGKVHSNFRKGFRSNSLRFMRKEKIIFASFFFLTSLKKRNIAKKYKNQFIMHQETIMPHSRVIKKNLARFEYRYKMKKKAREKYE